MSMSVRGTLRRAALVALGATFVGALAGAFVSATPAAAHVAVSPTAAEQGGSTRIAFRVPTESDTAATTKVEVFLPENAPVASVSTLPVPGWTATVQRRKLSTPIEVHGAPVDEVVASIAWTATGGAAIKPGQFQEFPISLGPLPTVDSMVFRTLQTYSDGTIVRWIDPPEASGTEPENPAPVLKLDPAPGASAPPGSSAAPGASAAPRATTPAADEDGDGAALGLGIAGLVAGLGGLVLGGLAFIRTRRGG
jgi:uncharacterized protein YcnI